MNRKQFEHLTDVAVISVLSFALGAAAYMGFVDSQNDDRRASEMRVLTGQIFELKDDIRDICRSFPEAPDSTDLPSEDAPINHPPVTVPTTTSIPPTSTPEASPTTIGEEALTSDTPVQQVAPLTPTTTVVQPAPCP